MAYDNRLELVINVDASQGNAAIQGMNRSILGLEQRAAVTAKQWGGGMEQMGASAEKSSEHVSHARHALHLLGNQIGFELPRAVRTFIASSTLLGTVLSKVFTFSVYIALAHSLITFITELGEKFGWWGKQAEEAAKKTRELNEEIAKQAELFDKYAENIEKAKRAGAMVGLSGAARTGAELGFKGQDIAGAQIELDALREKYNRLSFESSRRQQAGESPGEAEKRRLDAMNEMVAVQDKLREAENRVLVLKQESLNIQHQLTIEKGEEAKKAREAAEDARVERIGYERQAQMRLDDGEAWGRILDVLAEKWKRIEYGIEDATEKQRQLLDEMRDMPGIPAMKGDRSGNVTDYDEILKPMLHPLEKTAEKTSNQISTIVTDWSSALARAALDVRNFGSIILSAARSTAEMLLRTFIESAVMGRGQGGGGILSSVAGAAVSGGGGGGFGGFGGGSGGGGGGGGAGGLMGGLSSMASLKSFLGFGQSGAGLQAGLGGGGLTSSLSKLGHSNAALLGGGILAAYGLKRGGISGLAMTTAGGAMIGYKFGGPVGAAIGAGIGAIAGTIRLFVKGATEKARTKIKSTYGVDIQDKKILGQVVDIAKQGYGGSLDMAIRGPEIRDLVELYAMTTGQSAKGLPAKMQAVSMMQSGGTLYPGAGLSGSGGSGGGPITVNVTVPGAKKFFEEETVQVVVRNPRTVQAASTQALKSNSNRREAAALQLSPGTLTS